MDRFSEILKRQVPKKLYGTIQRVVSPKETVEKAKKFMGVMGITRVANITGLDTIGIPVVMVCRPNARSLAVAQGKGMSLISAKASGLMESIESYHAERITLPLKLASYEDLRYSYPLVNVDLLPKVKGSKFHPNHQILWIEGYDIVNNSSLWLPYELVHMNFTLPKPTGSGCFIASSNGLASGNQILEAISHGICEVIERDAMTMWSLLNESQQNKTRINLDTINDPNCLSLLEKYKAANIDVGIWDISSDIEVPCFMTMIFNKEKDNWRAKYVATGMGCHPNQSIALSRSLTEAAQSRLTAIAGSRDDFSVDEYKSGEDAGIEFRESVSLKNDTMDKDIQECPSYLGTTFNEDIQWLISKLKKRGINQIIVVNLTHPYFNIPVVKVVIPGLESLISIPNYTPGTRAKKQIKFPSK